MRALFLVLVAVSGWVGLTRAQSAIRPLAPAASGEIVLYEAAWCSVCDSARAYLDRHGVAYVARDVEVDPAAREAYRALGGAGALPLLVIGADTLTGFTPEQMDLRLYGARRGGS